MPPRAATSIFASPSTMNGSDPPSSSSNFLIRGAAAAMIREPTATEPVNAIMSVPGMLDQPGGAIAGRGHDVEQSRGQVIEHRPARRSVASGVCSLGLTMQAFPAASAAAACHARSTIG